MSDSLRSFAEIHLGNLRHNAEVLSGLAKGKALLAIVKANAYSHGAVEVSKALDGLVDMLGVSTSEEALTLRKAGIKNDILIVGYTSLDSLCDLSRANIAVAVHDAERARQMSQIASEGGCTLRVHLKINTGMNRLGISYDNSKEISATLLQKNLVFEGVFTHLAVADGMDIEERNFTAEQHARFMQAVTLIKKMGVNPKYIHCENTAGTAFCNFEGCNMVRCGIGLYGHAPDSEPIKGLKPVMSVGATVAQIRELSVGDTVSYGRMYRADKPTRIAILTIGYADGYPRALSDKGKVSLNGRPARVLGRVCMDYTMVDISDIDNVEVGDTVEMIGHAPADDFLSVSKMCDTIVYEILCGISSRVLRVYKS